MTKTINLHDSDSLNSIKRIFNQIASEVYALPRAALDATKFIPAQDGVSQWAGSWTFKKLSEVGVAKFISDYAEDLPPVSRIMSLETVTIRTIADSYGYSEAELMMWLASGIDLNRDDANTARRKIDEKVDEVLLLGDSEVGIEGFFNHSNVTTATIAAGAGSSTKIKDKTLAEIVATFQAMLNAMKVASKNTVKGDTFGIPSEAYSYIATTPATSNGDKTILEYLQRVFGAQGVVNWYESSALDGIGAGKTDRLVFYKKDKSVVSYVLPIPFRQKEAQECALHYKVPCYARIGGTVVKNAAGVVYGDGV